MTTCICCISVKSICDVVTAWFTIVVTQRTYEPYENAYQAVICPMKLQYLSLFLQRIPCSVSRVNWSYNNATKVPWIAWKSAISVRLVSLNTHYIRIYRKSYSMLNIQLGVIQLLFDVRLFTAYYDISETLVSKSGWVRVLQVSMNSNSMRWPRRRR